MRRLNEDTQISTTPLRRRSASLIRRYLGSMIIAVAALLIAPVIRYGILHARYRVLERIGVTCVKPYSSIEWVEENGNEAPAAQSMRLSALGDDKLFESIHDLKGLVRIESPEMALRLVRLTTDYPYAFRGDLEDELKIDRLNLFNSQFPHSLTSKTMQQLGFTPATVAVDSEGFVIDRWIFVQAVSSGSSEILHVREHVHRDGGFKRHVIARQKPPPSVGVNWVIPLRK